MFRDCVLVVAREGEQSDKDEEGEEQERTIRAGDGHPCADPGRALALVYWTRSLYRLDCSPAHER